MRLRPRQLPPGLPDSLGRRDLTALMHLKSTLNSTMPRGPAIAHYDRIVSQNSSGHSWKRLAGLEEASRRLSTKRIVRGEGGIPVGSRDIKILGPGKAPPVSGVTRTVFLARFEGARVRHRSHLVELGNEMLADYQGDEYSPDRVHVTWDPAVFAQKGDRLLVLGTRETR